MKKYGLLLSAVLSCTLYADTLTVQSGWNLLSISESSTTADCILDQMPTGSTLFKYDSMQKKWLAKSNSDMANTTFTQKGYPAISTISATEGFWLYNPLGQKVIDQTCSGNTSTSTLTDEQKDALAYMWNEEKLAKDVYFALNELYPHQTLYNIASKSETQHQSMVETLLEKYDLNILVDNYEDGYSFDSLAAIEPGKFIDENVQSLYDTLYDLGSKSLTDALKVGCMVEVTDINDLNEKIEVSEGNEDLILVFNNLKSGSYNHYWAFDSALKTLGITDGCCSVGADYCKTTDEYPKEENEGHGSGYMYGH